jgi:DNA-binding SARP family transcriptional activator
MLEQLATKLPAESEEASAYLEKWIAIAPFDRRAHSLLLSALARQGKLGECEAHLAATARLFETEGLDFAPIRGAWRSIKAKTTGREARPGARSEGGFAGRPRDRLSRSRSCHSSRKRAATACGAASPTV